MTLFLRRPDDPVPEEMGTEDDKSLMTLGIKARKSFRRRSMACSKSLNLLSFHISRPQDGDEVLVDEYDPDQRRKEEAKQREMDEAERAAREEEQGRAAERVAAEVAKAMAF